MKFLRFVIAILVFALLASACAGPATPDSQPISPLPTARVPPITEIDGAASRWQASNTGRYFIEVEEQSRESSWLVRLVVVEGQVRVAQRLERVSAAQWGEPVAISAQEAQDYTVEGLLARVRRDALGLGPAPLNMQVAFDSRLGIPLVVNAEALPSYNEDGSLVLNRQLGYNLTAKVKPLLEDRFGVGEQPVLTYIRSNGPEAWCDLLRVYAGGSSLYTDDCRDKVLQLSLPEGRQEELERLLAAFGSLDDVREENGGVQRLIMAGHGEGTPQAETVYAARDFAAGARDLLSRTIGLGLMLLYEQDGKLYGFDMYNEVSQTSRVTSTGPIRGAAVNPNGAQLVFSDDQGLKRLDIESGNTSILLEPSEKSYYKPLSWSNSSFILVAQVPETDGDLPELGWITIHDNEWQALPQPADSQGYGCDTGVDWSPDGVQLAITGLGYGAPCNLSPGLAIIDVVESTAERIVAPSIAAGGAGGGAIVAGAHTPAWSPDGEWIVFGLDQDALPGEALIFPTRLYRVRANGSDLTPLTNNSQGVAAYPVWSPDGLLYYSLNGAGAEVDGIYHYNPADNTHILLIPGANLYPVSISPDGDFMAYEQDGALKTWGFVRQEGISITSRQEDLPLRFVSWIGASQ